MINALWITLIGMGLVFVAILLLWGLMVLMVRLTAEKEKVPPDASAEPLAGAEPDVETASAVPSGTLALDRKRRAAAAAVAFAMALQRQGHPERAAAQPDSSLSAWQSVQRASQVSQKSGDHRKKVAR